jgi:diguanylate cyclase
MSDEAQRWKEKYLKSIDRQDKLERRWNARLDLLRRGLVRSSLAAEGADKAVDQCMKEMREVVRTDDMDAGLAALIPRLEKAVLDSEQRREQRVEQMGTALTSLVTQLQALPLPKDVSKSLKRLAKGLEERINQARELPLLLGELSELQAQALSMLEHPDLATRPGFLQRLFGAREASEQDDSPDSDAQPPGLPVQAAHPGRRRSDDPEAAKAALPQGPAQKSQWTNEAPAPVEPIAAREPTPAPDPAPVFESQAQTVEVIATPVDETTPSPAEVPADAVIAATEPTADVEPSEEPPAPPPADTVPDAEDEAAEPLPPEAQPAVEADAMSEPDPSVEPEAQTEQEAQPDEPSTDSAESGPFALPSSPEPSYSSVAAHIEQTLLGLLNDLTLPEHHRPQAEAMRLRVEQGLNWYELLPILDDLAVLMLAITDSGQQEFEIYLKQLNDRLESFQSNLQSASADYADTQSASRQLNEELREHVGGLQSSVQDAADLNSLKNVLESRLEGLISTMDQHQKERDEREQDVANTLQSLVSRVATMEQEAQGFRVHLEEQRQKALIDTLTGLPNRAAWNERLDHEIRQLQKTGSNLLMGILDLDHFKRINDGYGHLAGDKVLKIVASQLKRRLRQDDFIARFGGEEFVFLLPHTSMIDGMALLERLRSAIEQSPFHFKGEPVTITVSMGMTTFKAGERSDLALKRADEALYRAKGDGRNRIEQG